MSAKPAPTRPVVAAVSQDLFDVNDTIQRAAYEGNLALVEMLRRKGASIADRDLDGRSALHWASAGGHTHILEHMLAVDPAGVARSACAADDSGWTPLHSAVSSGHVNAVAFLLENGADTGATTKQGRTVLHYLKGSKPVAEIVVPKLKKSELNAQDEMGHTAMHRAAARGELDVVKLLVEHGGSPMVRDREGNTPLHSACEANEGDVCLFFLRLDNCAADLADVQNKRGLTPVDACATDALRRRIFLLHEENEKSTIGAHA